MVDCSIGTPCDPPPRRRRRGAGVVGHRARAIPPRRAAPQLREAAADWLDPPLRTGGGAGVVGRRLRGDQGAGRLGAARAPPARAGQGHRAVPGRVVPDLRHGSGAGRAAAPSPCRPRRDGRAASISTPSTPADAARALVLWSNSPSNPTGGLGDLGAEAAWGRAHGVPVVLRRVLRRVHLGRPAALGAPARRRRRGGRALALQALEPGRRARRLLRRRRRAGRVPAGRAPARRAHGPGPGPGRRCGGPGRRRPRGGPAARATASASSTSAGVLGAYGCPVDASPRAASTCGCRCRRSAGPTRGRWPRRSPPTAGLLVSPGDLYGDGGAGHVRVALVQPMERLALVGERLARVSHG